MIQTSECQLEKISAHFIGNKHQEESLVLSDAPLSLENDALIEVLQHYFLSHFSSPVYFSLKLTDEDGMDNPLYKTVKALFNQEGLDFHEASVKIAELLYDQSEHPNIKAGELFVVHLKDIIIEDELTDAIGLFKSETKQAFLKTQMANGQILIDHSEGINPDKLDKGCLILNTNEAGGYKLCVIDRTNKGEEAKYWKHHFLQVLPCADNYHYTESFMKATKKFVESKSFDKEFEIEKADKIDMLNSSVVYFRDNEEFNEMEYAEQVFKDDQMAQSFQGFRQEYQNKNNIPIVDEFEISEPAVKKQSKGMKSVLKLDKNFHIYIHGDRKMIEKGYDEALGKNFYKVYFDEEN